MGNSAGAVRTVSQRSQRSPPRENSVESLHTESDEDHEEVIDLDAPDYREYIKVKRKSLSEAALYEISYREWRKTNTGTQSSALSTPPSRTQNNNHEKVTRRISAPVTGNERFLVVAKNREDCEERQATSKQRIEETRKKYKLKDRDYSARSCMVWNEQDEKQVKKEREQRKTLRHQIRSKYNLPTGKNQRNSEVASG